MADLPDFRLLFEAAPASYLVLDPDFRILAATKARGEYIVVIAGLDRRARGELADANEDAEEADDEL